MESSGTHGGGAEGSARREAKDAGGRHELRQGDQQPGDPDPERGQRAPAEPVALEGDQQQRDDAESGGHRLPRQQGHPAGDPPEGDPPPAAARRAEEHERPPGGDGEQVVEA